LIKNKRYKNVEYEKFKIYDFNYLSIEDLKKIQTPKLSWRLGKFIDKVYRISLRYRRNDEYDEVYISDKDVKGILGELSHIKLIEFLNDNDLIRCRRKGNNRFNYNKKLWFFRLNREFFKCKKRLIEIEEGVLNKWIGKNNKNSRKKYEVKNIKKNDKNGIDDFVIYELECCKKTDVLIYDLDSVIENRVNNKLNDLQNESIWSWISKRKIKKNRELLKNIDNWKNDYRVELKNRFQYLKDDLYNLKIGNYENVDCKRDNYGRRLYNFYSRIIREFRKFIKIDGEESIEIDIKSSHISILYYLIVELNNDDCDNEFILDIKIQLEKLGNKNLGRDFLKKHKSIFEGEGILWSNDDEIDEYNDFYGFMKSCFNDGSDRFEYKKFINNILNSDSLRSKKNFNYKGYNIDELEKLFFGNGGYELINDLKKIDLFKYVSKDDGRIKPFNRSKNISLILHKLENELMDSCRKLMIDNNIIFISMFDSFIVKKNGSKKVMDMLNKELQTITKVVKFRIDM
tara:strand:- start:1826 stop:3367 length:1542 start_codon:yes stop_codon:yes gene_type:complete